MKFARFSDNTKDYKGTAIVKGEELHVIEGDMFGEWQLTGVILQLSDVRLLAPLVPNSIIGVGKNYVAPGGPRPDHFPDIPLFFHKPVTSVIGPEDDIVIPAFLDELKFESELAVVIGKRAKNVSESESLDYVFGYTIANDVSAVQLTHPDGHWMLVKSGDTFTPIGPYIETELNPYEQTIQAKHNGIIKQNQTIDLIMPISNIISYLSQIMTLQPGDVILTATPVGADMMKEGDTIECIVEGIGMLRNTVRK